ncbi:MAG: TolC family protein [Bacteroidota bacterium]|nr:TolC family protein [Bacteroidota bacterium]
MKKIFFILTLSVIVYNFNNNLNAQITEEYTLDEVIQLAQEQSRDAILAKHRFRSSYWEFKTYKAELLPKITLNSSFPQFNRAIKKYQNADGSYTYVEENMNNSSLNLSVNQNIGFTGGQLFVSSDLQRIDEFGDLSNTSYLSSPISIGYRQPILFFNEYKWNNKIEPLKYEEAKRNYLSSLEDVSLTAVNFFYDLALAQQNMQVAEINLQNADTLYNIAQGRFRIGTIAENELMQMELSLLNAGSSLNSAKVQLAVKKFQLRSFLGFNDKLNIKLIINKDIPVLNLDVNNAMQIAKENNPNIIAYNRQLIQAKRDLARAKSEKGLQADLFASFGLTQQSPDFSNVYKNPQNQQRISVGVELPILDWGLGKGRYKMAKSSQEVIKTTVEQARIDFTQNVMLNVMQFNLQDEQVGIALKSDTIAQRRYELTKQRFLIGKVDVLDLNVALSEKDAAKRKYVSALRSFWVNYYNIRKITLYDFNNDVNLDVNYKELVQ